MAREHFNQSLSEVLQNQSNSLITFDTQLKPLYYLLVSRSTLSCTTEEAMKFSAFLELGFQKTGLPRINRLQYYLYTLPRPNFQCNVLVLLDFILALTDKYSPICFFANNFQVDLHFMKLIHWLFTQTAVCSECWIPLFSFFVLFLVSSDPVGFCEWC